MGGRRSEFKCHGECQIDWRQLWEQVLAAGRPTLSRNPDIVSAAGHLHESWMAIQRIGLSVLLTRPLFPRGAYFTPAVVPFLGPQKFIDLHPRFTFS
jgi:hypothetical protein